MRYRKLGRTGAQISEVGLGTYTLTGAVFTRGDWDGPSAYGHVSSSDAEETVRAGLDLGLNFIDTAPLYGQAEAVVGRLLRGRSEEVFVETKVGQCLQAGNLHVRGFSEVEIRQSVTESKRRLGLDVLDIVLLHSPNLEELGDGEPLDVLCRLRDEGQIRYIGVSLAGGPDQALQLIRSGKVDVLQVTLNLLKPQMADEVLPLAHREGVGIVARVPLAAGFLTGTIGEDHVFDDDDYRSRMSRQDIREQARRAEAFQFLVGEQAESLPEAALRWVLSFEAVSTVIPGAKSPEEVRQNLAVSDKGPLDPWAMERIRALQLETL